jgi:hypothetical protein
MMRSHFIHKIFLVFVVFIIEIAGNYLGEGKFTTGKPKDEIQKDLQDGKLLSIVSGNNPINLAPLKSDC